MYTTGGMKSVAVLLALTLFSMGFILHFKQNVGGVQVSISPCFSVLRILGILRNIPEAINIYLTAPCGSWLYFPHLTQDWWKEEADRGGEKKRLETKQSLSSNWVTLQ